MGIPDLRAFEAMIGRNPSPSDLRGFVPQAPVVDSFSGKPEIAVAGINLVPVPGKEAHFRAFDEGDKAIYWKVSENGIGVEIIGAVWGQGTKPRLLCGIVLPP